MKFLIEECLMERHATLVKGVIPCIDKETSCAHHYLAIINEATSPLFTSGPET